MPRTSLQTRWVLRRFPGCCWPLNPEQDVSHTSWCAQLHAPLGGSGPRTEVCGGGRLVQDCAYSDRNRAGKNTAVCSHTSQPGAGGRLEGCRCANVNGAAGPCDACCERRASGGLGLSAPRHADNQNRSSPCPKHSPKLSHQHQRVAGPVAPEALTGKGDVLGPDCHPCSLDMHDETPRDVSHRQPSWAG